MKIDAFIFNWPRQFENTKILEAQLSKVLDKVTVINSDDDNSLPHWVNIGNESYFTAQFFKALELFDGDVMFHIQADASHNDWQGIVSSAKDCFANNNCGIYAPNVDFTGWISNRVDVKNVEPISNNLKHVTITDCTCWFINKTIIEEFKSNLINCFTDNKYGYGIDITMSAISYNKKMQVIRDYNYTIQHPRGTAYNSLAANQMMRDSFSKIKDPSIECIIQNIMIGANNKWFREEAFD